MDNKLLRRIVISGGGTGGHIFPAVAIAHALRRRYPEIEILFVGAQGRMEMTRVPQAGYKIVGLPVEGLQRKHLWKNFRVLFNYLRSLYQADRIIKDFRPNAVVGVGGYASAPTLKAAQRQGIPTLIQEQNSYAGVSNKYLSRYADCICVAYPDLERFFPKEKIRFTGNPIRSEIEFLQENRPEALKYFGFSDSDAPIVLVLGGSLGAKTINDSILEYLPLWQESGIRLIWQTGKNYEAKAYEALKCYENIEVYCSSFIDRMDYAYQLATLVVSRAGASTISELAHLAKPTILVPSPNVAEDHQTKNAKALSERGAAILLEDKLATKDLTPLTLSLVKDSDKLSSLSTSIKKMAEGNSAERIVDELLQIVR